MADEKKADDVKGGKSVLPPLNDAKGKKKGAKASKKPSEKRFTVPVLVISVVAAAAVGLLVGKFLLGGIGGVSGKTTLSEGELDSTVGAYIYQGQSHAITARQALEAATGMGAAKKDDGSYVMPSADNVLDYARNQILATAVKGEGIEVSDEDMATYAKDTLGTDDYANLASTYGMSEDEVKNVVRQSAGVKQLYDKIVGTDDAAKAPETPAEPADGAQDTPTADYGKYIVGLLGDEWDADKGTWAREDGPFYAALKDQTFSADSATYDQAMTAYYVAYQQYSQQSSTQSAKWTEYVNGLLSNASISIGELVS
ncbi:hypothetical protein AAK967_07320 [Atopobiaceae bacterium 24-176]